MASTNSESKSLFAAGGEANSDKESIWQQVLAQSAKKTQPLPSKTILLLGNSLLAALVLQFGHTLLIISVLILKASGTRENLASLHACVAKMWWKGRRAVVWRSTMDILTFF